MTTKNRRFWKFFQNLIFTLSFGVASTVFAAAPTINQISFGLATTPKTITLTGTGYLSTTVVKLSGTTLTKVSQTSTTYTANLPNTISAGDFLLTAANGTSSVSWSLSYGQVGPQGPQGAQGATGPAGPSGPQGIAGPVGATGSVGPAGPQGPAGTQGPAGSQGVQGPKGDIGVQGPAGPGQARFDILDQVGQSPFMYVYPSTTKRDGGCCGVLYYDPAVNSVIEDSSGFQLPITYALPSFEAVNPFDLIFPGERGGCIGDPVVWNHKQSGYSGVAPASADWPNPYPGWDNSKILLEIAGNFLVVSGLGPVSLLASGAYSMDSHGTCQIVQILQTPTYYQELVIVEKIYKSIVRPLKLHVSK